MEVLKLEIEKLEMGPGDYLAIVLRDEYEAEAVKYFVDAFSNRFPELAERTMIFHGDIKLSVIKKTDTPNEN